MEKKAQVGKKVHQKTLDRKKINLTAKKGKVQCEYCKSKVYDMIQHLQKCHRNPRNTPKNRGRLGLRERLQNNRRIFDKKPLHRQGMRIQQSLSPSRQSVRRIHGKNVRLHHKFT